MSTLKNVARVGFAAMLAVVLAACGGGSSGTLPDEPPPAVVGLEGSTDLQEGTTTIPANGDVTVGDTTISCSGDEDCVLTVTKDAVTGMLMATSTGGAAMVSVAPIVHYGDLPKVHALMAGDSFVVEAGESKEMGGVEFACPAGGGDPNVSGVSDIMVSVTTKMDDPTRDDDEHRIVVVDTGGDGTLAAPAFTYDEAVHKDSSTSWEGEISSVTATWTANPAAGWEVKELDLGAAANMDAAGDIWSAYFQHEQSLDGGRTLELDLRTDFGPGHWNHITYDATMQTIVRGAGGTRDEVTVDWDNVMFDDARYHLSLGNEVDLSTDGGEGLEGAYRADDDHFVRGRFVCVDGGAAGGSKDNECEIDHQTPERMGVSEGDVVVFLPYVHGDDSNWLAAGVWLTIPQDEENGDYAVGAFAFGNDPVEYDEANSRGIEGSATYTGEAFGRYAENVDIDAQAMVVGRFTADVELTADFGEKSGPGMTGDNNFGTIRGDVTGFMAEGEERDWDVNFETATIMLADDPANPGQPLDDTALRFNATASGHGDGGKATTGYWNGQFYGDPMQAHNDDDPMMKGIQVPWKNASAPGSAAGTFGLTSERDDGDNYLLVIEGAFAAHQEGALGAPQSN